jgi:hypothetical protein
MSRIWGAPDHPHIPPPESPKPLYLRPWFIGCAVLAVLWVLGTVLPVEDSTADKSSEGATTTLPQKSVTTTTAIPWESIIISGVLPEGMLLELCDPVTSDISDLSQLVNERLAMTDEPITDGYKSARFLEENSWGTLDHYDEVVARQRAIGLASLAPASNRQPSDTELTAFMDDVYARCSLTTAIGTLRASANTLDSRLQTIRLRATNLPWYPEGFEAFDGSTAYRFLKYGSEYRCTYSGAYCWGVEVVTKSSCSNLYAELTILDGSGRNIGYTNDVASNVRAGERVVLIFDTYEDGADRGRISEMSCY